MTKIHLIEDETIGGVKREYVEVDRKAEVGDKIVIVDASFSFGTYKNGDVMTVESTCDKTVFVEDFGEVEGVVCKLIGDEEYRVLIPVDSAQAEPTPDIHDLIANLAQRVTSLERITGELVRSKSSIESQLNDAIRNIERQAQELEREKEYRASIYTKLSDLKDEVESNTKDIAFLDDRTYEKLGKPTKSAEEILREISKILERDERQ